MIDLPGTGEASLGVSLPVLKPAFVENNDIIEWVELGQAFLSQFKEKWVFMASVLMAPFQSPPWLPCVPLPPFPPSFTPEVTGLQETGGPHVFSSCISLPGERSRWAKGAIMTALYQAWFLFPRPPPRPPSQERKDKSWKGIPLEEDWRAREGGDLSVG